jgi:hypothetical protein
MDTPQYTAFVCDHLEKEQIMYHVVKRVKQNGSPWMERVIPQSEEMLFEDAAALCELIATEHVGDCFGEGLKPIYEGAWEFYTSNNTHVKYVVVQKFTPIRLHPLPVAGIGELFATTTNSAASEGHVNHPVNGERGYY